MRSKGEPETLVEAIRYFADLDRSTEFVAQLRWPNGVECPTCGSTEVGYIKGRRLWQCKAQHPKRQFSVKVGTIFEDSAIGLDKWLATIWMLANDRNGISSHEVARSIGVTQKTAWFMLDRIRLAMQSGSFDKLDGHVEVDETYIGGKARNMHPSKRKAVMGAGKRASGKGAGTVGKVAVMGLLERHGEFRYQILPNIKRGTIETAVKKGIKEGSHLYTDALSSYDDLDQEYAHKVIDHAEKYVDGAVHTNGLENFWSLLKRAIHGTYVSIEPYHLFRYLDEQAFRFNNRDLSDASRFAFVLASVAGKRLTYKQLTGR